MLQVLCLTVGPVQENCYLLHDPDRQETVVVDPGDEPEVILEAIARLGGRVTAIWNTHAHFDHIGANAAVRSATGAPIHIHQLEEPRLHSAQLCGAAYFGLPFTPSSADHLWNDGDVLECLGRDWTVHLTPGHSPGLCCLSCDTENLLVAGDLLFQGSIGRTDLPGCSPAAMDESLRGLFTQWGKDTWRVLPGHGPETTIAFERKHNPFVREALA